jgi:hypothetical protein
MNSTLPTKGQAISFLQGMEAFWASQDFTPEHLFLIRAILPLLQGDLDYLAIPLLQELKSTDFPFRQEEIQGIIDIL